MKLPTQRAPIHPGEILLEEFLKPMEITQIAFAKHVGWTPAKLSEIIHGKRGLTPETALDLSDAFGTSVGLWLGMQMEYDAWHALKKHRQKPLLVAS